VRGYVSKVNYHNNQGEGRGMNFRKKRGAISDEPTRLGVLSTPGPGALEREKHLGPD